MELQAITPKPPAFEIAATKFLSETQLIAPPKMAVSVPKKARPRAHKLVTRIFSLKLPMNVAGFLENPTPICKFHHKKEARDNIYF
jgi:hypothetical protein